MISIYGVERVPPSAVTAIEDSKVCKAAAIAYSREVHAKVSAVHVIKVGSRYAVTNPEITAGEWKVVATFDSTFARTLSKAAY